MNREKSSSPLADSLPIDINRLLEYARETGFCTRIGKIHPVHFWEVFCSESVRGTVSYNDLAGSFEAKIGPSVSRQAMAEKISTSGLTFFKRVLGVAMATRTPEPALERIRANGCFRRIIVQDSTVLRLPERLYPIFSGVRNATTTVCNARIQGVYDILAENFLQYSIDSYSRNDLVADADFLPQSGDLVLKDRGYLKYEGIATCIDRGADCIFRYKHPTTFHSVQTGKCINLAKTLNKQGTVDLKVVMGSDAGTAVPLRLVAFPVPEEVANLRRMKARKETKGRNPSKELLHLLGWTIFITTLPREKADAKQIAELYGLRWRIENIFKTWKSNFCFDHIHNVSAVQLRMLLVARLTVIALLQHRLFIPLAAALEKKGRELSLMKFMRYAQRNLSTLLPAPQSGRRFEKLVTSMQRYCAMEKRKRKSLKARGRDVLAEIAMYA